MNGGTQDRSAGEAGGFRDDKPVPADHAATGATIFAPPAGWGCDSRSIRSGIRRNGDEIVKRAAFACPLALLAAFPARAGDCGSPCGEAWRAPPVEAALRHLGERCGAGC